MEIKETIVAREASVRETVSRDSVSRDPKDSGASRETRDAILAAARNRFLHYGFKKTTIDEIAADAGVGKGTVYLYFQSKEEILLTIARGVKRNITEQMRAISQSLASPEEKVRRMLLALVMSVHDAARSTRHGAELVDEMLHAQLQNCGRDEHEAQMALLAQALNDGVALGTMELPSPAEEVSVHMMLAMVSFLPPYLNPCHSDTGCRIEMEQRSNRMLDFLLFGLRARR